MNILIVAGGNGTRLWPASRQKKPKQLLTFLNDKTLLQNTYERFSSKIPAKNVYVATAERYASSIQKQLPGVPYKNYSLEPVLRDRAPAIGLAALIMDHDHPNSVFATSWSDSHIEPKKKYLDILRKAEKFLSHHPEMIINVGVKPSFPHTGLGYIEQGKKIANKEGLAVFQAQSFKEKPNHALAKKFLAKKTYLWNTGMFIGRTTTFLELYKQHLPEIYEILMQIKPFLGTKKQQAVIKKLYAKMPSTDIEKGLMEKLHGNLAVIAGDFLWGDIGSWKVIKDIQSKSHENVFQGLHIDHDSRNTLVYNYTKDQLVTTLGLDDIAIVVTPEAILVAHKDQAEEIKVIIKKLKTEPKLKKYL
jgi:mannose-1-phosphate guanylyltransferase